MFNYLRGIFITYDPPYVVLDVNGIGYELEISAQTLSELPLPQQELMLYTHFVVREDAQLLYGFVDKYERALFRELIKVSGIGPKLALQILSGLKPATFVQSVLENNSTRLKDIPGIGKKMAERLIIEMRDRLKDWALPRKNADEAILIADTANHALPQAHEEEALSALVALGFKPHEARQAIGQVTLSTAVDSSEQLVRLALQTFKQKYK